MRSARRTRTWWLLAAVLITSSVYLACVNDDPSTSGSSDAGPAGSVGEPCLPDGTCDIGLSCVSNVCVDLVTGGDDSGSPAKDASVADASDAGTGTKCEADAGAYYSNAGYVYCPKDVGMCSAQDGGNACCAQPAHDLCVGGAGCNVTTGAAIRCLAPSQCNPGSTVCCMSSLDAGFGDELCPRHASVNQASCQSSCTASERTLCTNDADCTKIVAGLVCRPYVVSYNGDPDAATDTVTVGFCVVP